MATRRELSRTATVAQIKQAALAQIATEGASALSIRGVARAIGMSPAGMYRYYDSRDALLTDLLTDAYQDLASSVAQASGLTLAAPGDAEGPADAAPGGSVLAGSPLAAMLRAIEAYRAWAVQGPERFMLIFGTPVPGYAAPEGGPTVTANRRMGQVFFTLAALAWREGLIAARPAPRGAQPTPAEAQVHAELVAIAPGFPSALIPVMLSGWALWHGLVTLEITGQLEWIYPDADAYYTDRMTQWLAGFAGNAVQP